MVAVGLSVDIAPSAEDLRKSYDEVKYRNLPMPCTHIARLAAIGALRGLSPADPVCCRVLELGCADGGNLLPMAVRFPHSRFLGIDLSPVQIENGRRAVTDLSVENLELRTADILELKSEQLERYDFIIAHGVFSWVSPSVRERILSICRDHLSENGLAYVSYNTYPGWYAKQVVLDLLRFHTRQESDPRAKAQAAFALLSQVSASGHGLKVPLVTQVQQLLSDMQGMNDPVSYLVHEYLIDENTAFHFREFCRLAEVYGLRYVDDALPASVSLRRLPPAVGQWVSETTSDYSEQQQYVDLFGNVAFRRSLLCHDHLQPRHEVTVDSVLQLFVSATSNRRESEDGVVRFQTDSGRTFSVEHPGLQAVLESLVDSRPASMSMRRFRDQLGCDMRGRDADASLESLLQSGAIELTAHPFQSTRVVTARPYATRLARYESATGFATSAAHRPVSLTNDVFARNLLQLLDGTRTVPELVKLLQGRLSSDTAASESDWEKLVREHLSRLADFGLLVAPEE